MSRRAGTVYLIDDDAAVLKALRRLLASAGYGVKTFERASDFLESPKGEGPACMVLDLQMPGLGGLDLQRELAARGMGLPVIFLTGHGDIPQTVRALKAGAFDFLTKPVPSRALLEAIGSAIKADSARRKEDDEVGAIRARLATLTPREHEVLRRVISGKLNKQTAFEMGIVEKTVKFHRAQVMRKLGVDSLAELVLLADRAGVDRINKGRT